jgi:hypothetical protein
MAKWTPEQLKEKLALWISAENVRTEDTGIYGTSVSFVKEALDLSGNQSNAYNKDSTNVSRPILKNNAINGLPSISFSDFDLSKAGEGSGDYSANNFVIPDHLMIDHAEKMDFSTSGASIFVVYKPNLKRELGFKFLPKFYEDKLSASELVAALSGDYKRLNFPDDQFISDTLTTFENDDIVRATDIKINDLSTLLPTLYNAPGFQIRLQIDDLYANDQASNFSRINSTRAEYGLPALVTSAEEDTFGDAQLDYLAERGDSGLYKIKTVSSFGNTPLYTDRKSEGSSSYSKRFRSDLKASGTYLDDLGVGATPNFNESYDEYIEIQKYTELHRSSNDRAYEPFDADFSILSIVTNVTSGSIDDTGEYDTWTSSSAKCGFFKNGEHFGGNNNLIAIPGTANYSGWVHSIGAPIDLETGRIQGGHDTLDWNVAGADATRTPTEEASKVKAILEEASKYGASTNDLSADFFAGEIAEMIIFKEELSEEDRKKVEGYLSLKYNIALVAGHLYGDSAPSYNEDENVWSLEEEDALVMWISADDTLKGKSTLSRYINPDYGSRTYYSANEDVNSYFTELEDSSYYIKRFNDKTSFRNDLVSLEAGAVGSRTWPLYAAKEIPSEVNSNPAADIGLVPSKENQYINSKTYPSFVSSGNFTNIKYTNTTSQVRTGGIYLKATPKDEDYDYPLRGKDWIESRRLLVRDKPSVDFILKEKDVFFDKSNFELIITTESGLGENYYQNGDMILLTGTDTTHAKAFDNNGIYQVVSYNNSNGEIKIDLFTKYKFMKRLPISIDPISGFHPNPVALGTITKVVFDFADLGSVSYYGTRSDEFLKFKSNGGSIFFVMKPDSGANKQYLLTNGAYNNGASPIWITVGGAAQSGGSDAVPAQLRFAYEDSSTVEISGTSTFRVNANGSGQKYYSITFHNVAGTSSTAFDTTNNGDTLANAYTANIYTGGVADQSTVMDLLIDLFNSNPFDQNAWSLSKVNSQVAGAGGTNNQLNITGPSGDTSYNITNIVENVGSLSVDSSAAFAASSPSESGTNAVGINDLTVADVVSTTEYAIYEFVFPGLDEDISGVSDSEALDIWGIWKNGQKKLDDYPNAESWGSKTEQNDSGLYIAPPVSSDTTFEGNIAEILIFADDLSADKRKRVEWYFSNKYNIPLEDSHIYSQNDPSSNVEIKWSPKNNPENLFAWYAPETLNDNSGNLRWLDQHNEFRADGNDDRHLNPLRNFTAYQPTPASTEDANSVIPYSDIQSGDLNGLDTVRFRPDKGLAFYGFLRTAETLGFSAFAVLKYNESEYNSDADYQTGTDGSILELANQFHNENNSSPKTRYYVSISDTIDGYANNGYDNNLETIYLEPSPKVDKLVGSSSVSETGSVTSNSYQIVSIISRDKNGANTREQGFYSNGVVKGETQASSFGVDTIVVSGGGHDISVAEIILYDKELNDFERQRVEGYLACKYNLESVLPSDHPYKDFCPEIDVVKRLSKDVVSDSDGWTPYGKDGLIGLYTPEGISSSYDHSENTFSAKIAPYVLGDLKSHNAVTGVSFEDLVGQSYFVHCGVQNAYYEALIKNDIVSETKTQDKYNEISEALSDLLSTLGSLSN